MSLRRCGSSHLKLSKNSVRSLTSCGSDSTDSYPSTRGSEGFSPGRTWGVYRRSNDPILETSDDGAENHQAQKPTHNTSVDEEPSVKMTRVSDDSETPYFQYFLLVALAFQLPNLLQEIVEILELHYHSFPVLVVFGLLPGLFVPGHRNAKHSPYPPDSVFDPSTLSFSSSGQLRQEIENFYKDNEHIESTECLQSLKTQEVTPTLTHSSSDEWGHFADFEETATNSILEAKSEFECRNLSPLHETEEEE